MSSSAVRIFRVDKDGERLCLAHGARLWDLSAKLEAEGRSTDLLELAQSGWMKPERLASVLPDEHSDRGWTPADLFWDGNAPEGVLTPLPPSAVGKVLALGKNFRAHAQEFNEEVPAEPLYFNKLPECLVPHGATVSPPLEYDRRLDHEAELAVVIGRDGARIEVDQALDHVAGWSVANDLTLRSLQGSDRDKKHPWFRAKNFDGACPFGPAFVPRDSLDAAAVRVRARLGTKLRQDASTADLVVGIPEAIAHLSKHLSLNAGDLILMGTPAGVGPLEDGDEIVCSIDGIGELATRIERRAIANAGSGEA